MKHKSTYTPPRAAEVKAILCTFGVTHTAAAELLHCTPTQVGRWANGQASIPFAQWFALRVILGAHPHYRPLDGAPRPRKDARKKA